EVSSARFSEQCSCVLTFPSLECEQCSHSRWRTEMNHAPPEPAHSGVADRHVPIDRITRRVANPVLSSAIRLGWGPKGARILTVTGRRSGLERHSIVIPTEIAGS